MGKIILNGIEYTKGGGGGGATIEEMSLSQYEQLPDTKNSDNIVRALWDVESLGEMALVNIFTPSIYSDTERKIGVWRDNKPLYQKTLVYTNQALASGNNDLTLGISDIENVCNTFGVISNSAHTTFRPLNTWTESTSGQSYYVIIPASNVLRVVAQTTWASPNIYVTIQYTKTTDIAGSGSYTTEVVPAHHYSTNETVVGTWITGKPLYERTIEFNCANTSNVQTAYSIPSNYFVRTVCDAYFENSANNLSQQFRYTWYKDHFWSYIVNNSGHAISVHRETTDGNWQSGVKFVAIIRYTKTDD